MSGAANSAGPRVTDKSAFSHRSLGKQVLFSIITFGFYTMYWTYITAKQLDRGTDQNILSPILIIIPIVNLIVIWQMCQAAEAVQDQSGVVLFILFIFFAPLSWYWIQSGINSVATS